MQKYLLFFVCGSLFLAACGGGSINSGSMSSGSPNAVLSTTTLTFGDEVVGATSQPLTFTLTNSGVAALSIANVVATANFGQINDCGSTLAAGAKCIITVTFTPGATGKLNGTISISDSATGSPQTTSLSGTGVTGTVQNTLTGYCWGGVANGAPLECGVAQDTAQCPVGQQAVSPTSVSGCLPPQSALVDTSTSCKAETPNGKSISGSCMAQISDEGGSCSVQGQDCGSKLLPPCCSGLTCVPASTRAFCQPD